MRLTLHLIYRTQIGTDIRREMKRIWIIKTSADCIYKRFLIIKIIKITKLECSGAKEEIQRIQSLTVSAK